MELEWIKQQEVSEYWIANHDGYRCSVIKCDWPKPYAFFVIGPDLTLIGVGVSLEADYAKISCQVALDTHKGSR